MRTRTLITATVAALATCGAATAGPAQAIVQQKRAYFTAKISGLQTTKWDFKSGTYTDCNGTRQQVGNGTEVVRFESGGERVTFDGFGNRTPTLRYDQWSRFPLADSPLGALSDVKVTRHAKYRTSWLKSGWCTPAPEPVLPDDCGQRKGIASIRFDPYSNRKIRVEMVDIHAMKRFDDCRVSSPSGIDDGVFTDSVGKLSSKLIFGRQKKIVVVGGKTYRRSESGLPATNATSTTYFKLTLTRHVAKKGPRKR